MRDKHNAQSFPYRQRDRGMVTSNPIESEFLGWIGRHTCIRVICTRLVSEELGISTDSEHLWAHNGRSILFCCLTTLSSLALPIFSSAAWWRLCLFQIGLSTAWGNKRQCFRLGGSSGSTTAGFIGWRLRGLLYGTYGTLRRCCSELSLYDQWIWEEATRNRRHECWWNFRGSLMVVTCYKFPQSVCFSFWGGRRSNLWTFGGSIVDLEDCIDWTQFLFQFSNNGRASLSCWFFWKGSVPSTNIKMIGFLCLKSIPSYQPFSILQKNPSTSYPHMLDVESGAGGFGCAWKVEG